MRISRWTVSHFRKILGPRVARDLGDGLRYVISRHDRLLGAFVPLDDLRAMIAIARLSPEIFKRAIKSGDYDPEDVEELLILYRWSKKNTMR